MIVCAGVVRSWQLHYLRELNHIYTKNKERPLLPQIMNVWWPRCSPIINWSASQKQIQIQNSTPLWQLKKICHWLAYLRPHDTLSMCCLPYWSWFGWIPTDKKDSCHLPKPLQQQEKLVFQITTLNEYAHLSVLSFNHSFSLFFSVRHYQSTEK